MTFSHQSLVSRRGSVVIAIGLLVWSPRRRDHRRLLSSSPARRPL